MRVYLSVLLLLLILPLAFGYAGCCLNPLTDPCSTTDSGTCCPSIRYPEKPFFPRDQADCLANFFWQSDEPNPCLNLPGHLANSCTIGCCCLGSGENFEPSFSTKAVCHSKGGEWRIETENCETNCGGYRSSSTIISAGPNTITPSGSTTTTQLESLETPPKIYTCSEIGGVCRKGLFNGGLITLLSFGLIPWCNAGEDILRNVPGCGILQRCCVSNRINITSSADSANPYELVIYSKDSSRGGSGEQIPIPFPGKIYYLLSARGGFLKPALATLSLNNERVVSVDNGEREGVLVVKEGDKVGVSLYKPSVLFGAVGFGYSKAVLGYGYKTEPGLGTDIEALDNKQPTPIVEVIAGEGSDTPLESCEIQWGTETPKSVPTVPEGTIRMLTYEFETPGQYDMEVTFRCNAGGKTSSSSTRVSTSFECREDSDCHGMTPTRDCEGEWRCINYLCDWSCTECSFPEDCSKKNYPHPSCPGNWSCNFGDCVWECEGEKGDAQIKPPQPPQEELVDCKALCNSPEPEKQAQFFAYNPEIAGTGSIPANCLALVNPFEDCSQEFIDELKRLANFEEQMAAIEFGSGTAMAGKLSPLSTAGSCVTGMTRCKTHPDYPSIKYNSIEFCWRGYWVNSDICSGECREYPFGAVCSERENKGCCLPRTFARFIFMPYCQYRTIRDCPFYRAFTEQSCFSITSCLEFDKGREISLKFQKSPSGGFIISFDIGKGWEQSKPQVKVTLQAAGNYLEFPAYFTEFDGRYYATTSQIPERTYLVRVIVLDRPDNYGRMRVIYEENLNFGAYSQPVPGSDQIEVVRHTVAAGETLSSIADYYKIYWPALADFNDLTPPHTIYPYNILFVPKVGQYLQSWESRLTPGIQGEIKPAAFDKNFLMEDDEFLNYRSISSRDLRELFKRHPQWWSSRYILPDAYWVPRGYAGKPFSEFLSDRIIYWANEYRVNPILLLSKIQSEQSFIITKPENEEKFSKALLELTGCAKGQSEYYHPDGQLRCAARFLRQHFENAVPYFKLKKLQGAYQKRFFDENLEIYDMNYRVYDVVPQNAATYSLYKYTNHVRTSADGGGNLGFYNEYVRFRRHLANRD